MSEVYVRMHRHVRLGGSGGMLPQEIRCSEIASEAIFGTERSIDQFDRPRLDIAVVTSGGAG